MISHRLATADDAPLLERLFRLSFVDTFGHLYAAEDLAAFLAECGVGRWREELADPDTTVRLVLVDGEPAGFVRVGPGALPKQQPEDSLELRQLYLLPEHKGRGLGRPLLDWAIATARARGAQRLYLSVFIDNHRARQLYERQGFVAEGPYTFMVGSHADEDIVMRLDL